MLNRQGLPVQLLFHTKLYKNHNFQNDGALWYFGLWLRIGLLTSPFHSLNSKPLFGSEWAMGTWAQAEKRLRVQATLSSGLFIFVFGAKLYSSCHIRNGVLKAFLPSALTVSILTALMKASKEILTSRFWQSQAICSFYLLCEHFRNYSIMFFLYSLKPTTKETVCSIKLALAHCKDIPKKGSTRKVPKSSICLVTFGLVCKCLLRETSAIWANKFHIDWLNWPNSGLLPNSSPHEMQLTSTVNSWLTLPAILTQTQIILLLIQEVE